MTKTLLVDFDSKIPNLALMKLSAYEKSIGNTAGFDTENPDKIYCSVVFSKNRDQARGIVTMFPGKDIIFGGSGWDLNNHLPEHIETMKPDYDLYPSSYSQGFTTRGCIRKCPFCVVPEKEGYLATAQHPSQFHDDRFRKSMWMDNNLLAAPREWVRDVFAWAHDSGVTADLTQGVDARLMTEEYAGLMKDACKDVRMAWDNMSDEKKIFRAIDLLEDAGFDLKHHISFYVLSGFNTTFDEDLYRCNKLRDRGVNAFVMLYHRKDKQKNRLARWANRRWSYWSGPFNANDNTESGHICDYRDKT